MASELQLNAGTNANGEVNITHLEVTSLHPSDNDDFRSLDKEKQTPEPLVTERDLDNYDPTSSNWLIDPQNPINWSSTRKWTTVSLLVVTNFIA